MEKICKLQNNCHCSARGERGACMLDCIASGYPTCQYAVAAEIPAAGATATQAEQGNAVRVLTKTGHIISITVDQSGSGSILLSSPDGACDFQVVFDDGERVRIVDALRKGKE